MLALPPVVGRCSYHAPRSDAASRMGWCVEKRDMMTMGRERKRRGRFMLGSSPWKAHWHVCFYCQHRRIHIARLPLRLAASAADPPPAPPNARCGFALALTPSRASIANLFSLRHSLPPLNMCNNAGGAAALGDGAFGANLITFLSSSKAFSELRKVFCRDESEARLPFLPFVLRKRGKG